MAGLYDEDVLAWSIEQAALLRARRWSGFFRAFPYGPVRRYWTPPFCRRK